MGINSVGDRARGEAPKEGNARVKLILKMVFLAPAGEEGKTLRLSEAG